MMRLNGQGFVGVVCMKWVQGFHKLFTVFVLVFVYVCNISVCGVGGLNSRQYHRPHDAKADAGKIKVQPPDWTWLAGQNVGNQMSALSHDNVEYPGSLSGGATWQDPNGNLWLFGGEGHDQRPSDQPHFLNDLWRFDTQSLTWHLVMPGSMNASAVHMPKPRKHPSACGVEGIAFVIFGGEQTDGTVLNDTWVFDIKNTEWLHVKNSLHPESRSQSISWCDQQDFIIFGGYQKTSRGRDFHSDLWLFSMKSLEWKKISSHDGESEMKSPRGRIDSVTWTFQNNTLYMFGGKVKDLSRHSNQNSLVSELWVLSLPKFEWTLIHGENSLNKVGHYSDEGFTDKRNIPGSRGKAASWTDGDGNLWMFGGEGIDSENDATVIRKNHIELLSDLWLFDTSELSWICVTGSQRRLAHPIYGVKGQRSKLARPGGRSEAATWCKDEITYIFGGYGYDGRNRISYLNDLWSMDREMRTTVNAEVQWLHSLKPNMIFLACLSSFGGIVLILGMGFFLKKYLDFPNGRKSQYMYNVRYSPLKEEAHFET